MNSCRNIFDDLNLTGGSNASLLMSHYYLKKLDDQSASRIELFTAMKGAAVKVNPLYSRAFTRRQNLLKNIATPKYFKTSRPLVAGLGNSNVLETGLSLNPTYGLPMIPASTIKGITAHYCATVLGSENEDYYEQLLQLIEDMKNEDKRAETEGLTEEELEMFDLLIKGRKLTKDEEQKVKLAAKNLYKKLTEEKQNLFIVDWYKDEQASTTVKDAIISSLDADLPQSFDKEAFDSKINLLLNHFVDMSVQHYGWLGNVA